jgi:hypothetical protein
MANEAGTVTPYSTVAPFFTAEPGAIPEEHLERIQAYETFERIYWSVPRTFTISMRGTNDKPIYIPNARAIVNETTHYLLKGLSITSVQEAEGGEPKTGEGTLDFALKQFMKRERFLAKFMTAKLSGVTRGDWIIHLTADPDKQEGQRLSVNSVDPAAYFPEYEDDDIDRVSAVNLVEHIVGGEDGKDYIKRLRYEYADPEEEVLENRTVLRTEQILEVQDWFDPEKAAVVQTTLPTEALEDGITTIPVYHFKNIDWQGDPFGRSELTGFEALQSSINQTISDEELALALMGLGVYATDAPTPTDDNGEELGWELSPGMVEELPSGAYFKKVEGINTVTPNQDHLKFLIESMYEGSGTFRTGSVDVQLAESGVALALRFSPTMAKLESRDLDGTSKLEQFWYDWKFWYRAYEGQDFTEQEIAVALGQKLPTNRVEVLNELNNMLDRQVIDRVFYREEMKAKLGYEFPDDMSARVLKEQEELTKVRMFESPVNGQDPTKPTANNSGRPNESAGSEAD